MVGVVPKLDGSVAIIILGLVGVGVGLLEAVELRTVVEGYGADPCEEKVIWSPSALHISTYLVSSVQ